MKNFKFLLPTLCSVAVLTACSDGVSIGGPSVPVTVAPDNGSGNNGGGSGDTPQAVPSPVNLGDATVNCFDDNTCTISGTITQSATLTPDIEWRLQNFVQVGNGNVMVQNDADVQAIRDAGVTLSILPGTNIRSFSTGALVVTRGSQLLAEGTASAPITFSSVQDDDFDGLGEWGGVVIQGFAPQYGPGGTGACFGNDINAADAVCNVSGEGGSDVAVYGGDDVADNSGIIRYVRIAEGGLVAGPNNEINGLTLQGVGHGTTVEYVQVHNNLDDGVEWFGGTVNARYLVLTGNDDDDIDFDEGFEGNIQYAIVKKSNNSTPQGSNDPRAIEANSSDDEFVEETNAVLSNISILGGAVNNNGGQDGEPGMRLRGALDVEIHNTAVANFDNGCVRVESANFDDTGGNPVTVQSEVVLNNVLGDCERFFRPDNENDGDLDLVNSANFDNVPGGLSFDSAYALLETEASVGLNAPTAVGSSGFTFDATDYVGAVEPGTAEADAWWSGWTIPGSLSVVADDSPSFVTCNTSLTPVQCTLQGTVDEDYTLRAGIDYALAGFVTVGSGNQLIADSAAADLVAANGVTLSIEAGANIQGLSTGALVITRGSRIQARGTANLPITFSSLQDADFDGLGEWGGVVVQGFAPQFGPGGTGTCVNAQGVCNVSGEGGSDIANYGGNNPADDSGFIRYVRIAEGGLVAGPNNEINGLTLQGVGHETNIEFVQVHNNLDDGVEWFGGTVNARYLVLTGNDDDDIDFDEGYQGNIQFGIVVKSNNATPQGSNDPRGIEANSSDDEFVSETNAVLANIALIGGNVNNNGAGQFDGEPGMRLRGALTVDVINTFVTDFNNGCVRAEDAEFTNSGGANVVETSDIDLVNVLGDCERFFRPDNEGTNTTAVNSDNVVGGLTIDSAFALTNPEAIVAAPTITAVNNGSDFQFEATTYVGPVEPGTAEADAWWSGWTIPNSLNQ